MSAPVREELEEIAHNGETMRVQQDLARPTMRVKLIGHFKPCMTEIYIHIVARMAD